MKGRPWLPLFFLSLGGCAMDSCTQPDRQGCATDSECAVDERCSNGTCISTVQVCNVDLDCPNGWLCEDFTCIDRRTPSDAGVVDAAPECAFGEARCLDQTTLSTCDLGRWASADCRRNGWVCHSGRCQPPPCPEDGSATRCVDLYTEETCSGPDKGTLNDCGSGRMCWRGACGGATGEPCATDQECAGGACWCKPGSCTDPALAQGFCTQQPCSVGGTQTCAPGDVCVALSSSAEERDNVCVPRADDSCPTSLDEAPLGYAGPFKRVLPIPDPDSTERYRFGPVTCFAPWPRSIGATCTNRGDCMGGSATGFASQCIWTYADGTNGYCTHACDATHPCPPEAACAHFPDDPVGAGKCLLRCGSQRRGLATCDRSGFECVEPGAAGFSVMDGSTDPLGYCAPRQ